MNQLEISFGTPLRIVVAHEEVLPQPFSLLTITDGLFSVTAKGDVMYTMPILYSVKMQVSYVDAQGNPATVQTVTWSSSDTTIISVTPDAADMTVVTVTAVGKIGQAQVAATADVDLGAGVKNLVTLADISIVAGEAVAGTITPVGDPIPPGA